MRKISVITGVYNEELIVRDSYIAIKNLFKSFKKYQYEHIFLDNCSSDTTLSILKKIASRDKHVKILSYSKNFGPIKSGFTGIKHASGDGVVLFEANMKDPVELIAEFIKYWEKGYELVYGARKETADNFLLAFARRSFYRLMNFISTENLPLYFGGFALIDRRIIDAVKDIDDYKPYLRGLITTVGFKHKEIEYKRGSRPKGKGRSKSDLGYLIDFTLNAIVSYSIAPMRICIFLGLAIATGSVLWLIIYLIINIILVNDTFSGFIWAPFLILFFSGVQLFFLGIIGEYIGAIHSQVRKKPFVIIKEKINFT